MKRSGRSPAKPGPRSISPRTQLLLDRASFAVSSHPSNDRFAKRKSSPESRPIPASEAAPDGGKGGSGKQGFQNPPYAKRQVALSIIGIIVSIGLIAVSAAMNFRFGQLLGKSSVDGLIYGFASLCGDGLKTVLPFVIAANWHTSRYITVLAALLLLLILTAYSLTSSLGFAAINRSEVAGAKQLEMDRYQALTQRLATKRAEYRQLPAHRPFATIDGDIQAAKQHLRWATTKECTDVTLPESREHCAHYFSLTSERGTAETAAKLDIEIKALTEQVSTFAQGVVGTHADPQVQILQQIANASEDRIKLALTLLISLFVELGSSMGLYLSSSSRPQLKQSQSNEGTNELSELFKNFEGNWHQGFHPRSINKSTAIEVYPLYLRWCSTKGRRHPLTVSEFCVSFDQSGEPATCKGKTVIGNIARRRSQQKE